MHIQRLLDLYRLIMSLQIVDDPNEMLKRYRETIKRFGLNPRALGEKALVSIIIPTRNEADRISNLLRSIRLSSYRRVEILIVNYMSSDGTPDIARTFGAKVIEVDRPGVGYASFLATNIAKGDMIIRTDADAISPRSN